MNFFSKLIIRKSQVFSTRLYLYFNSYTQIRDRGGPMCPPPGPNRVKVVNERHRKTGSGQSALFTFLITLLCLYCGRCGRQKQYSSISSDVGWLWSKLPVFLAAAGFIITATLFCTYYLTSLLIMGHCPKSKHLLLWNLKPQYLTWKFEKSLDQDHLGWK